LLLEIVVGICGFGAAHLFWIDFGPRIFDDGIAPVVQNAQVCLNAAFVVLALWRIFRIFRVLDVTEKFYTYLYVAAAASVLLQNAVVFVLGKVIG
jgi:hypothetical protein